MAPGQRRLEAAHQVVQRPGDDHNVVGVTKAYHHHGGKADALENWNAVPNGHSAWLQELSQTDLHQKERHAEDEDADEVRHKKGT